PGTPTVGNPYPYAANDPINKIDPLGLSPVKDSDLHGLVYGPPDPRPHFRDWEYPTEEQLIAALTGSALRGENPVLTMYAQQDQWGCMTVQNIDGAGYIQRY